MLCEGPNPGASPCAAPPPAARRHVEGGEWPWPYPVNTYAAEYGRETVHEFGGCLARKFRHEYLTRIDVVNLDERSSTHEIYAL